MFGSVFGGTSHATMGGANARFAVLPIAIDYFLPVFHSAIRRQLDFAVRLAAGFFHARAVDLCAGVEKLINIGAVDNARCPGILPFRRPRAGLARSRVVLLGAITWLLCAAGSLLSTCDRLLRARDWLLDGNGINRVLGRLCKRDRRAKRYNWRYEKCA